MRIELKNGYVVRTDKRQFILGKEKHLPDGSVAVKDARYCHSLIHGLTGFISSAVKESDAGSFQELIQVIKEAQETIRLACNAVGLGDSGKMGTPGEVLADQVERGITCGGPVVDDVVVEDDDEEFDDL